MNRLLSILAVLLASALGALAVVPPNQSVTFAWDAPVNTAGPFTFKLYKVQGPGTNLLFSTQLTTATVSNITPTAFSVFVTASNERGESDPSVPYSLPAFPSPPVNLRPVTTRLEFTAPVTLERSADLANWNQRFRIYPPGTNGAQWLVQTVTPIEPMQFYRVMAAPPLPPLP